MTHDGTIISPSRGSISKRPFTTFEIYKRLSNAGMEHKTAVAIAESIDEFVEEQEHTIRAELSSKRVNGNYIPSVERSAAFIRSPGLLHTAAPMLVKDKSFAIMTALDAITWTWLIWEVLCK